MQSTLQPLEINSKIKKKAREEVGPLFKLFTLVRHFGTLTHFVRHYAGALICPDFTLSSSTGSMASHESMSQTSNFAAAEYWYNGSY